MGTMNKYLTIDIDFQVGITECNYCINLQDVAEFAE